jgi:hypothetical protein
MLLFILAAVFTAALIYKLYGDLSFSGALLSAARTALAVFLAWALCREIDPANDRSAFISLPAVFVAALLIDPPSFLGLFFALLTGRTINRSYGLKATSGDSLLLVIMAVILFVDGFLSALPFLALIMLCDILLEPANRNQKYFVPLTLAVYLAMLICCYGEQPGSDFISPYSILTSAALILSASLLIFRTRGNRVYDDLNRSLLSNLRISATQALIAIFFLAEILLRGSNALIAFYPALLAYFGAALYHAAWFLKRKRQP